MSRRRSTHQAPDWTPTQTVVFLVAMVALACALAFAAIRIMQAVAL